MRKSLVRLNTQGQAALEYVLILAVTLMVVAVISVGLKRSLITVWERMTMDVAAPCPSCPPPSAARFP